MVVGKKITRKLNTKSAEELVLDNIVVSGAVLTGRTNKAVKLDSSGHIIPTDYTLADACTKTAGSAVDNVPVNAEELYIKVSSNNNNNKYNQYAVLVDNTGKLVQAKDKTANMSSLSVDNEVKCNNITVNDSLDLNGNGHINLNGKKIYKNNKSSGLEIFSYNSSSGVLTINY